MSRTKSRYTFRPLVAAVVTAVTAASAALIYIQASGPAMASSSHRAILMEAPGERRNVALSNYRSRHCVNAPGGNGGNVLLLRCGSGWGQDRWDLVKVKDASGNPVPHQYFMINTKTRVCLEVGGWSTADGATGMTFGCHNGTNQIWRLSVRSDGYYEFRNLASGKCLDARLIEEWTDIYQWGCHGGGEQRWWIQ